jgi:cytochrome c5
LEESEKQAGEEAAGKATNGEVTEATKDEEAADGEVTEAAKDEEATEGVHGDVAVRRKCLACHLQLYY